MQFIYLNGLSFSMLKHCIAYFNFTLSVYTAVHASDCCAGSSYTLSLYQHTSPYILFSFMLYKRTFCLSLCICIIPINITFPNFIHFASSERISCSVLAIMLHLCVSSCCAPVCWTLANCIS